MLLCLLMSLQGRRFFSKLDVLLWKISQIVERLVILRLGKPNMVKCYADDDPGEEEENAQTCLVVIARTYTIERVRQLQWRGPEGLSL